MDQNSISNHFSRNLSNTSGLPFVSAVGLLLVLLIVIWCLGQLLYQLCGIDVLRCSSNNNRENEGFRSGFEERNREQDDLVAYFTETEALKQERREKYMKFLQPYSKVIQESDVYHGIEKPLKGSQRFTSSDRFSFRSNKSLNYDGMSIASEMSNPHRRTSDCCTIDSRFQCWIKIHSPSSGREEAQYVEGYCSICLLEIEVGDTMVQSTRRVCHHIFHQDCALTWLSTGKKRCPVCRNFFVPGSRVDEQDAIQHKDDDLEALWFGTDRRSLYCYQKDGNIDDPSMHISRKSSLSISSRGMNQDLEQPSFDDTKSVIENNEEILITKERSLRGKALSQIHPL